MSDLGPLPTIHPRSFTVDSAKADINSAVLKAIKEHRLTYGETIGILSEIISSWARNMRRKERHPDPACDEREGLLCSNPGCQK